MVLTEGKEKYWRMVADFTTAKTAIFIASCAYINKY